MPRDCAAQGHVQVEGDPECLACDALITTKDKVGVLIPKTSGELADPNGVANPAEWGAGGTAPT